MASVAEYISRMRIQALLDAQKNAMLPIEQGGLGLPAGNTTMERAKALGYTVPLWHSSPSADIHKFNRRSWFANQPEISETYLQKNLEGSSMYPVLVNPKGFGEVDFGGAVWNRGPYTTISGEFPEAVRHMQNEPRSFSSTDSVARVTEDYGMPGAKISNVIDRGPNFWATPVGGGDVYVVHDPSKVRSRFAAFDPLRKHESEILASHPLASAGAALAAGGGLSGMARDYLDQPYDPLDQYAQFGLKAPMSRGEALKGVVGAVPGIGEALSGAEALQAASEGKWGEAGLGALGAAPLVGAIKTYHMTPHTFDQFDLSKAKSGLGGMMHGRGVYTVDNPEHAADWAGQLPPKLAKKAKVLDVELKWPDAAKEAATPLSPEDYIDYNQIIGQLPESTKNSIFDLIKSNPDLISKWNETFVDPFSELTFPYRPVGPTVKHMRLEQELAKKGIPGFKVGFDSTDYITFDPRYANIIK